MKKVVLITGSPRKDGNSKLMADCFDRAARAREIEVKRYDAVRLSMAGCYACNDCFKNGSACAVEEKFNELAKDIMDADGIVMAAPVYWYSIPSQMKAVMDHFHAFKAAGKSFTGKKCALITCCEEDDANAMRGFEYSFRKSMEFMDCHIVDEIMVPGVKTEGDIENTQGMERAAALADKFLIA
ncbi:NADPH-dependent FMN reductase [Lachnospiraceae bacterium]|nr:NADPH-dependent FMN reductase [Lachnospiraceae bacterium]